MPIRGMSTVLASVLLLGTAPLVHAQADPAAERSGDDAELKALLRTGTSQLRAGRVEEAIAQSFAPLIARYESRYKDSDQQVYGARSPVESLAYLLVAANAHRNAVVIDSTWGDAHYLMAYALVELKRLDDAAMELQKAIDLSPQNALYLSELGNLHAMNQQWEMSLQTFKTATDAAALSPDSLRIKESTRALRGQGYAQVELGRLDEAKALYERCLVLDPDDAGAKAELGFIETKLGGR
jgi:tetratricopeptide (TPR) repeat protein